MRHLLLPLALSLSACTGAAKDPDDEDDDGGTTADGADGADGGEDSGEAVAFALTSAAFEEGGTIPTTHECGPPVVGDGPGDNATPPLSWTAGPAGTAAYALVMRDLDFTPAGYPDGLLHWVVYDIPADARSLDADLPDGARLDDPAGALQAELQNSGYYGYLGPCSPSSVNTYSFTIHALGTAALSPDDDSEITVAEQIEAASLASASLSGES